MAFTVNSFELKTKEQWIEFITQQELPALTSTAQLLEKFENDDVSSLPKLSKAILHDQALSSCVIKVANNINRAGVNAVTTVSRATVVLGMQTVKNICLTSKIIEGLLRNEDLGLPVFNRIKRLMARSFFAGQLAKMMVPEYSDDTQEELYLASMLHNIGETAFWSVDSPINNELIKYTGCSEGEYQQKCDELLGLSFEELSVGLAKNWNLGELLIKSFDEPEYRAKEVQVINLATTLSQYIDSPPESAEKFDKVIDEICSILKINDRQLKHRIELTRESSIKLLKSYGAVSLVEYIKPLPLRGDFKFSSLKQHEGSSQTKDAIQLEVIQNLTQLSVSSSDINDFLQTTLIGISQTLNFDRNCFLFLSKDKSTVSCRFSYDSYGRKEEYTYSADINKSQNVFRQSLLSNEAIVINSKQDKESVDLVSNDVSNMMGEGRLVVAPVQIAHKCIGFACSITSKSNDKFTDKEVNTFQLLVQQLNMCLSIVSTRKSR